MSSNDEPQLTRRQMRERRGVDTQGVPIVGAGEGSTSSGDAAKTVPAAPATRSRRVSTSAAVAGGQIPDMQAAERAAADASTDAEKAEAARQTAPALSLEEIAELEKRAQAGIPLTRRQARDLEKAKTASVPIISAADAAAARAASAPAVAADASSSHGAASEDLRREGDGAAENAPESSDVAEQDAAAAVDSDVESAGVESGDAESGDAEDSEAENGNAEASANGNGEAADNTASDAGEHGGDDAVETAPAKTSKRSKRAEKKAAQEAKRAEEASREAADAEAAAGSNGVAAKPATPVAPIRPAFIGKPAANAAPLIERLDNASDDGEQTSGRPGPRRSSYTPLGADDATGAASTPSDAVDAETVEDADAGTDTDGGSPSRDSASAKTPETIVVPEVVENSHSDAASSSAPDDGDSAEGVATDAAGAEDGAPKLAEGFGEQVLEAGTASSTTVPHEQPFDRIIARGVEAAEAQAASNALILPTMPTNDSLTGPISSNGNVIVTGSIDLPASLSSTGQHPNYFDKAELDTMFEADEEAAPATAGTPVSAARAVSTHTQTGDVINPPAPSRDHRLLIILAITAGALLTAVLAVVIVGFVVGAF
ncbi:hypothetical protein ALI44B_03600 [Leifsonia sp. ALI-44-B]|uniref:hypothetical protein n=1 Tax=Leifsonia sp. ALI-44-B TaxID=1933776 RepID=UPI00097CA919|nr:hypothetical protein [Leifsonia sp. ALI-44-B]ONI63751.1 hypothetical protein ALI44B_03600 [Leifsonia sp. ALI-44-B]